MAYVPDMLASVDNIELRADAGRRTMRLRAIGHVPQLYGSIVAAGDGRLAVGDQNHRVRFRIDADFSWNFF